MLKSLMREDRIIIQRELCNEKTHYTYFAATTITREKLFSNIFPIFGFYFPYFIFLFIYYFLFF